MRDPTSNRALPTPPPGGRKDHFIPQMYLRAFVDPTSRQNELWRYGPGFSPQLKAPKGVAWEGSFYDAAEELNVEENDIERGLAEIKAVASPHLQKLRDGCIRLTVQEKNEFGTFIALLLTRTRSYRELVNTIASQLYVHCAKEAIETPDTLEKLLRTDVEFAGEVLEVEAVRRALRAVADGYVLVEQTSKAWTMRQMFEDIQLYDDFISLMHWNLLQAPAGDLLQAPAGCLFITSDNPVILHDPVGRAQGPEAYHPSVLSQLQLPLSPEYLLVGDFTGRPGRLVLIAPELVAQFNQNQVWHAHKEVQYMARSAPPRFKHR